MPHDAWKDFERWCIAHGEQTEPLGWTTLVRYIRALARSGATSEAVRMRIAELGRITNSGGRPDATSVRVRVIWSTCRPADLVHLRSMI